LTFDLGLIVPEIVPDSAGVDETTLRSRPIYPSWDDYKIKKPRQNAAWDDFTPKSPSGLSRQSAFDVGGALPAETFSLGKGVHLDIKSGCWTVVLGFSVDALRVNS
jgi:hypothetical protein